MLSKLIKHEWRALKNPFIIFLVVLIITTALSCITLLFINPAFDEVVMGLSTMLTFCMLMLYYLGLIACSIGPNIVIAIRFYKSCYTDEGYLTHTLPISSKQLLLGKLLTYFIFSLAMGAIMVLSVFVIIGVAIAHFGSFSEMSFAEIMSELDLAALSDVMESAAGIGLIPFILFLLVYCIGTAITHIIIITGCVSLGQLMTKHRVLGAILAYFAFYMIVQTISTFAAFPMTGNMLQAEMVGTTMTMWELMSPLYIFIGAIYVVVAVIMYFVNLHMMTKKLNLE